jgi:tRNA threonylcarbamoyladenosine biosynthesis protein TsaB
VKFLALDTATEACTAALYIDGAISSRHEIAPRRHAELILPMVDALLAEADVKLVNLDFLAFGRGPGAFTGVRIATGVIQGLAYAAGLPVVPVSTLAILAQGAARVSGNLVSAIDARMGEVYWGLFRVEQDMVMAVGAETVSSPEQVRAPADRGWFGVGSGWKTYPDELRRALNGNVAGQDGDALPHARDMIRLALHAHADGAAVAAEAALPVYLRNQVAGKSGVPD